jgi:hypothetical protein
MIGIQPLNKNLNNQAFSSFNKFLSKSQTNIRNGMKIVGSSLVSEARQSTMRPKTGIIREIKIFTASGKIKYKKHQASAPGESHAKITGKLGNTIKSQVDPNGMTFGYKFTPQTHYGVDLELGTAMVKSRPTLGNAVKVKQQETFNTIKQNFSPKHFL